MATASWVGDRAAGAARPAVRPCTEACSAKDVTVDDGRTDAPLLEGADMLDATYELTFRVGTYFAAGATGNAPLFNEVPVRFTVSSDVRRLHLALLVTPWSETAYRGS